MFANPDVAFGMLLHVGAFFILFAGLGRLFGRPRDRAITLSKESLTTREGLAARGNRAVRMLLALGLTLGVAVASWWMGGRLGYVATGAGLLVLGLGLLGWSFVPRKRD